MPAALAADGDIDTTFGDGGFVLLNTLFDSPAIDVQARSAVIDSAGRVIVSGMAQHLDTYGNRPDTNFAVFRLTDAGQIDTSFVANANGFRLINFGLNGIGPPGRDSVNAMTIQSDGKIVLAGAAYFNDYASHFALARVDDDGTLDTSFGQTGSVHFGPAQQNWANDVAVDSVGNIVIAGETAQSTSLDDPHCFAAVARLTSNGVIDSAFNFGATLQFAFQDPAPPYNYALGVAVDAGDSIVTVGGFDSATADMIGLQRFTKTGRVDTSWGGVPLVLPPNPAGARAIYLTGDGGAIVGGSAYGSGEPGIFLEKLLADGSPDAAFGDAGVASFVSEGFITFIAPSKRGGWIAAGPYRQEGLFIVKVLANGQPDATFGSNGYARIAYEPPAIFEFMKPALLPDGKLVAVGYTADASANGNGNIGIMRVFADYDTIFVSTF